MLVLEIGVSGEKALKEPIVFLLLDLRGNAGKSSLSDPCHLGCTRKGSTSREGVAKGVLDVD